MYYYNESNSKIYVLILEDITLKARITYIEGINEFKSRMVASISHELKTPLNNSINMLNLALS